MTAYNAQGDDSDPENENVQQQATCYLYESEINPAWQTGVVYPDSTDALSQDGNGVWTISSGGDHVSTTYDRLGRTTSTTDQRGVEHTYSFDTAGRLAADTVAVAADGSGAIACIPTVCSPPVEIWKFAPDKNLA